MWSLLEVITKLAYSRSKDEYDDHYVNLLDSAPKSAVNVNWHEIKYEWVECFKSVCIIVCGQIKG